MGVWLGQTKRKLDRKMSKTPTPESVVIRLVSPHAHVGTASFQNAVLFRLPFANVDSSCRDCVSDMLRMPQYLPLTEAEFAPQDGKPPSALYAARQQLEKNKTCPCAYAQLLLQNAQPITEDQYLVRDVVVTLVLQRACIASSSK